MWAMDITRCGSRQSCKVRNISDPIRSHNSSSGNWFFIMHSVSHE